MLTLNAALHKIPGDNPDSLVYNIIFCVTFTREARLIHSYNKYSALLDGEDELDYDASDLEPGIYYAKVIERWYRSNHPLDPVEWDFNIEVTHVTCIHTYTKNKWEKWDIALKDLKAEIFKALKIPWIVEKINEFLKVVSTIKLHQVIFVVCIVLCFYGTNHLAHYLLPKWIDMLVGFPLSIYLMYRVSLYYINSLKP